jgi:hypothetical protein
VTTKEQPMNQPKVPADRAGKAGQSKTGQPGKPAQPGKTGQAGKPGQGSRTGQNGQTAKNGQAARTGGQAAGTGAQVNRSGRARPREVAPAVLQPPKSVQTAVRLMYAGAILTAVGIVIDGLYVVFSNSLRTSHPHATAAQIHATKEALIVALAFSGLIEIGLWIFVARANRAGMKWARIVAAVFFGIYTVYQAYSLPQGATVADIITTSLIWLAGLAATYFLWQRESTSYFNAPATSPSGRPG